MKERMTIREYREFLAHLDQDKCIWCITSNPMIHPIPPMVEEALEGDEKLFEDYGLKKGDYIITEIAEEEN